MFMQFCKCAENILATSSAHEPVFVAIRNPPRIHLSDAQKRPINQLLRLRLKLLLNLLRSRLRQANTVRTKVTLCEIGRSFASKRTSKRTSLSSVRRPQMRYRSIFVFSWSSLQSANCGRCQNLRLFETLTLTPT